MERRKVKIFIRILLIIVVISILFYSHYPSIQRWRIASLIQRHKAYLTQGTANRLARLLDKQAVGAEQGSEILQMLMTPTIIKRESYRVGKHAYFEVSQPFDLSFGNLALDIKKTINDNKFPSSGYLIGGYSPGIVNKGTSIESSQKYLKEPGTYSMSMDYEYKLIPLRIELKWHWPSN